jgi:sec-independent protein translocase protein TatC
MRRAARTTTDKGSSGMVTTEEERRATTDVTVGATVAAGGDDGGPLAPGGGASPTPQDDYLDEPMTLQEHLKELRDRLIKIVLGVVVGMVGGFLFAQRVLEYMKAQVLAADPQGRLIQTEMTEAIVVYFKIAFYLGIAFAMPVIVYQLIRFLAPGLTRTEKRYVYAMLPFVLIFFALGVSFSSAIAIPNMIHFLLEFSRRVGVANDIRVEAILGFYANLSLWTGIVFEMPLVMFLLASLNIVSYQALRRTRKYASVALMVLAAVITPTPDALSMLIVWAPMYVLFELGLILARFAPKRRQEAGSGA